MHPPSVRRRKKKKGISILFIHNFVQYQIVPTYYRTREKDKDITTVSDNYKKIRSHLV